MSTTVCSNLSIEDILMAIEDFRKSLQDYAGMIEALDADMLASIRTNLDVLLREYQEVPVLSSDPCSMLLPVFLCLSSERQGYKDLAREFEVRNGQNSRTSSKPPRTDGYHRGEDAFGNPRHRNKAPINKPQDEEKPESGDITCPTDVQKNESSDSEPAGQSATVGMEAEAEIPVTNEYGETEEEYLARTNRNRSLRGLTETGNTSADGEQDYHRGCTMPEGATVLDPVYHIPEKCIHCENRETCTANRHDVLTRNVLSVKVTFTVEPHVVQAVACPKEECDSILLSGSFPSDVSSSMQYGSQVKAMAMTLTSYGFTSWEKTRVIMGSFLGRSMGKGCIEDFSFELAAKLQNTIEGIKNALWLSKICCLDETGYRVDSRLGWIHSACNTLFTYVSIQQKRGLEGMSAAGFLDYYENLFVTDAWKPYMGMPKDRHAMCNGHALRECLGIALFFEEDTIWSSDFIELMLRMNSRRDELIAQGSHSFPEKEKEEFYNKYDETLSKGFALHPMPVKRSKKNGPVAKGKALNLLLRLKEYKQCYCMFVENFEVPFTNNTAEQSFRSFSEKMGVSQCFKTWEGARAFMVIWSYISSCIKHKLPIVDALVAAFEGRSNEFLFGDHTPERPQSVADAMKKAEEIPCPSSAADSGNCEAEEITVEWDKVLIDKLIPLAEKQALTEIQIEDEVFPISFMKDVRKEQAAKRKEEKQQQQEESEKKAQEREERRRIPFSERLKSFKDKILEEAANKAEKFMEKYGRGKNTSNSREAASSSSALA